MRVFRGSSLLSVVTALSAAVLLAGCAAGSGAAPTTVLVTETAAAVAASATAITPTTVTVEATSTAMSSTAATGTAAATGSVSAAATMPSQVPSAELTGGPFIAIDPLALDCAVVMTGTELTSQFGGGLQRGTNRSVEGANPDRGITGRLKCQYGVSDDKSVVALQIVFAQFQSADQALTQLNTTVESEKSQGASASTAAVRGYLAHVLLRDGGLLVVNYGSWNMSVVANKGLVTDAQLPAALAAVADYALAHAVG